MFSFGKRKKIVDATPHMRRVVDLTAPNLLTSNESRQDRRYNRALATCMCPWLDGSPDHLSITIGVTKDVSDQGICVLTTSRLDVADVLVTFLVECDAQPGLAFFRAAIERENRLGGFFEYGLSIVEYLNDNYQSTVTVVEGLIINSYQQHFLTKTRSHGAGGSHPIRESWGI